MKLKFRNGITIDIRKFTREYAQNQSGKTYLNITATYESPAVFDRIASAARNTDNISLMEITDDDGNVTVFDEFKLDNVIEIHDGLSNDVTIRAYKNYPIVTTDVDSSESESASESGATSESLK